MSVFISQLVPRNSESSNKGISQAAMNFCHNYIIAVNPNQVYALSLISEKNKKHFIFDNPNVNFIQCRFFPHVGIIRFANAFIENLKIVIDIIKSKERKIWFYNITAHNFISFLLLKLFRKECFIILADFEPRLTFNKFSKFLVNISDGIISFSANVHDLFPKHSNIKILPGIINKDINWEVKSHQFERSIALFSGSLNDYAGIELALLTFSKMPEITLIITGSGKQTPLVESYAKTYKNINYLGHIEYEEYIQILNQIDIVLSLRNPTIEGNFYNFPSKILEYFINRKIVISTMRHNELPELSYVYCDYDELELISTIQQVKHMDENKILSMQELGQDYVKNKLSYKVWKSTVQSLESD